MGRCTVLPCFVGGASVDVCRILKNKQSRCHLNWLTYSFLIECFYIKYIKLLKATPIWTTGNDMSSSVGPFWMHLSSLLLNSFYE